MTKKNQFKKKILIVEDDAFLSSLYVKKFTDSGFDVSSAFDGQKGLELAKRCYPDLIILDLLLPEMNGYDVLSGLKKDSLTNSIPVVVLTNFFQKDDIKKCFKMGVKDYLIKSHFMPNEVVEKVKEILKV